MSDAHDGIPRLSSNLRPIPVTGAAVLTKLAFDGADLNRLLSDYQARLLGGPEDAGVVLDISTIFQLAFNREPALEMQNRALAQQQLFRVVGARGDKGGELRTPELRLLAFVAPGDLMVNTPLEFILEQTQVVLDLLYVVPGRPLPAEVPEHDVAIVAVSEPDANHALLHRLSRITAVWPRPVINDPKRILLLSRDSVFSLLHTLPGVMMPLTWRVDRSALVQAAASATTSALPGPKGQTMRFPLIVRPIGSHAGSGLRKIHDAAQLTDYLGTLDARECYLMPFVDYRGTGGLYRKYRIVFIEGQPYLCHMAVSEHWMVHYLNAGMQDSEAKRREESKAMASFERGFARRHSDALRAVNQCMSLDYFGIDCAETKDGELLIFEADIAMVIHDMDPPDIFPYKGVQMKKVFSAFAGMLYRASHGYQKEGLE